MLPPSGVATWPARTLLGRIDARAAVRVARLGRRVSFRRHEPLLLEGDHSTNVFVLLSGVAKVVATASSGREILLAIRVAGDVVGELAAMDGSARTATVRACNQVVARDVSQSSWQSFLEEEPTARDALIHILGDRLRVTSRRQADFGSCATAGRVARILADFGRLYGRDTPHGRELSFEFTQSELAAAAGCAEASVHKALLELRLSGVVVTRYRRQVIVDPGELDRRAGYGSLL